MYFKDIIGQDNIVALLRSAVAEGRIPHAQLICGGEGVGKVAVASREEQEENPRSRSAKLRIGEKR